MSRDSKDNISAEVGFDLRNEARNGFTILVDTLGGDSCAALDLEAELRGTRDEPRQIPCKQMG